MESSRREPVLPVRRDLSDCGNSASSHPGSTADAIRTTACRLRLRLPRRALVASAVLRGAYHLYQGFGGFVGNAVMGLLFGWLFLRTRRVMPLVVAHTAVGVGAGARLESAAEGSKARVPDRPLLRHPAGT